MGRDLDRQRHAERLDQVEHHLAARRGRLVHPVQVAVVRVALVVIDVDREASLEAARRRSASGRPTPSRSARRRRVRSTDARDLDAVDAGELHVVLGRRVGVDEPHVLAERLERVGHRQLRADGVAVGAGVRGDQETLARVDRVADLTSLGLSVVMRGIGVVRRRAAGRPPRPSGPGGSARCGPGGRPTCRRRTASSGTRRSRSRWAIWRRRNGVARPSALRRLAQRLLVAHRRVVDARELQVGRDLHLRQRDEADAGIVDVPREQLGQLVADGLSDAIRSVGAHVSTPQLHNSQFPTNSQFPIPNFPFELGSWAFIGSWELAIGN